MPFYPLIFDAVLVNVTKVNYDLQEQLVRTPDNAEIGVKVSITWTPNKEDAEQLINFLNSGEHEGVQSILHDVIGNRLREWAFLHGEGPATWEEAVASGDEAVAILLKAILGDDLTKIPSDIPTSVLLKYFSKPRPIPSQYETQKWGRDWEKLEKELKGLGIDGMAFLKEKIEHRRELVKKVCQGSGEFIRPDLGIVISRLTISIRLKNGATDLATEDERGQIGKEADPPTFQCTRCGAVNDKDAQFCRRCGKLLKEEQGI